MRHEASLALLLGLVSCASNPPVTRDAAAHDPAHDHDAAADLVVGDRGHDAHLHDAATEGPADDHGHTHDAPSEVSPDVTQDAAPDAPRSTARDLTIRYAAAPHGDRLAEFALVGAGGSLLARAALRGNAAEEEVVLRGALPDGTSQVAWFVDENGNQRYDPPPIDRAGRVEVAAPPGPRAVSIQTAAPWADIGAPTMEGTLRGRFSEFEVHVGVTFELSLTPEGSDRTVALYRYRSLRGADAFDFALQGVLREGQRYVARWFIDLNDNGVYDVRGDHGGELAFDGRARGVTLVHQHHMNRAWVE